MYKWMGSVMLVCVLVIAGCSMKDEDVAAVVRGEEVLVEEMRLLYPDDVLPEMVDEMVKAKLVEQEVKKMDIDISEKVSEVKESYGEYPPEDEQSAEAQSIRTFAQPQAEKLHMEPEEYYEAYVQASAEQTAYVHAYMDVILGGMDDDEFGIEEYSHHANHMLDELVELNENAIEVKIHEKIGE